MLSVSEALSHLRERRFHCKMLLGGTEESFSVKTRSSVELLVACDMIDGYQFLGPYLCSVTASIWRFCLQTRRSVGCWRERPFPAQLADSTAIIVSRPRWFCVSELFLKLLPQPGLETLRTHWLSPQSCWKPLLMVSRLAQHLLHLAILPSSTLERTALQNRSLSVLHCQAENPD